MAEVRGRGRVRGFVITGVYGLGLGLGFRYGLGLGLGLGSY